MVVASGRSRMLPFSWGHIARRLTSSEATMAVESRRSRMLRSSWGPTGRRLTSSDTMRGVGSAEAEGAAQLEPYRLKADKQRGHEVRGVGRSRVCYAAGDI